MTLLRRYWYFWVVVFLAYGSFIYIYDHQNQNHLLEEMHRHSLVVEDDMWTMNPGGSASYLALAAARDNYSRIAAGDVPGRELISVEGPELKRFGRLLDRLGLIPQSVVTVDVKHEGQVIGYLTVHHRDMNIYVYLYAGLVFCLILVVIFLFLNMVQSKEIIEQKVLEGTFELRKEIDQRQRLEGQVQRAEKMELVGSLAGGVAHDLNNILGAIIGYPDLLLEDLAEDDPLRKPLVAIKTSGERAALIVQDLLTLARRGVAVSEPENLNTNVTRYLESPEFAKLLERHPNVTIETHLQDDLKNVMGSAVHLTKALMNLCDNSADAMPEGGRIIISTANVSVDQPLESYECIEPGQYVVLTIEDNGSGISEADQKRVFEPFYTRKAMGRSGSGLGLAVVWGAVKDHKGFIDVSSRIGVGTTVMLYFPITSQAVRNGKSEVPIEEIMGDGETILVVDDQREPRELAIEMLKRLNYTVVGVSSGEEAVEYLGQNTVQLVVLDMIMEPGIDGLECYKRITQIRPQQRAIIASGFSETDGVRQAQDLGAGEYVRKPYTLEVLGGAVKKELCAG